MNRFKQRSFKLRWTPKRSGAKYCSPACGRGCTFAEYQAANRKGQKLAWRLGKGWKVRVWENLGWHFEVLSKNEKISVREWTDSGYSASICHRWNASAPTPEKAVLRAQAAMKGEVLNMVSIFEALFGKLKTEKGK